MKILLLSVGSRGDTEPFISLGKMLQAKGHNVTCAFPGQFKSLTEKHGLTFLSLGDEFLKLIECEDGRNIIGGFVSPVKKLLSYARLIKKSLPLQKEMVLAQEKIMEDGDFDRAVFHVKAIYPLIWHLNTGKKAILVCPFPYLHYTKSLPQVSFAKNMGPFLNKLTYALTNFGISTMVKKTCKELKSSKKFSGKKILKAFLNLETIYTISPTLFPKPYEYEKNIHVLGFNEIDSGPGKPLDPSLEAFLQKHPKVLFLTFGSMTNAAPEKVTATFLKAFEKHAIPVIINTANGGLEEPHSYNKDLFYFVKGISYKTIFPRVYGVIHHGGAGTTHYSLRYGCATLIIPHIVDQFTWNTIVSNKGAGPKGIAISKILKNDVAPLILDLYQNQSYKEKATAIKVSMEKEAYQQKIYNIIVGE